MRFQTSYSFLNLVVAKWRYYAKYDCYSYEQDSIVDFKNQPSFFYMQSRLKTPFLQLNIFATVRQILAYYIEKWPI